MSTEHLNVKLLEIMVYLSRSSCILSTFKQATPATFGYWEALHYELIHRLWNDAISPVDAK